MSYTVIIDPGHGGEKPGAIGPHGLKEKDVTLKAAKMLARHLHEDYGLVNSVLTRTSDETMSLTARAEFANTHGGDCLVSIHCNSVPSPYAKGFEIFTSPGYTDADQLATMIWLKFREDFPGRKMRLDASDGDEDKEARFTVLTRTVMPAVLIEYAFISNPEEETLLADDKWLWQATGSTESAIRNWLSTR